MDSLLKEISVTRRPKAPEQDRAQIEKIHVEKSAEPPSELATPQDALQVLKNHPDLSTLERVLVYLRNEEEDRSFHIKAPGALQARITHVLVQDVVPNYWTVLSQESDQHVGRTRTNLIYVLSSIGGLGALVAGLRTLISTSKEKSKSANSNTSTSLFINDLLDIVSSVVRGSDFVYGFMSHLQYVDSPSQRTGLWKEFLSLVVGSKILATAAEAIRLLEADKSRVESFLWLGHGAHYARWLAGNLARIVSVASVDDQPLVRQFLSKCMMLGYTDVVVEEFLEQSLRSQVNAGPKIKLLLSGMSRADQRRFLEAVLRVVDARVRLYMQNRMFSINELDSMVVSAVAALIDILISADEVTKNMLVDIASYGVPNILVSNNALLRPIMALLSRDEGTIRHVLAQSMTRFGDQILIKHTPLPMQEGVFQSLLLSAAYVNRFDPDYLRSLLRSSMYLNGISNRLSTTSIRARTLGMVAGMILSEFADVENARMKFELDESQQEQYQDAKSLAILQDSVGTISDLRDWWLKEPKPTSKQTGQTSSTDSSRGRVVHTRALASKPKDSTFGFSARAMQKAFDGSSRDNLIPHAKPDSDPEDSEDDATLVQRKKATAPVYIRDLISGLQEDKDYDKHRLALSTAATLIRRKTGFGNELSDLAEDVVTTLIGLQDNFDINDFQELRIQGMTAILIAKPEALGPHLARLFFEGDYSISQRMAILTSLCLGGRELAGFKDEDASMTGANKVSTDDFPSEKLPARLHEAYRSEGARLHALTVDLEKSLVQPLAASAADELSGPNALKVRTFSSRIQLSKQPGRRARANAFAGMVANAFFFPLTSRWWTYLQSYGDQPSRNPFFTPLLLSPFLRSLGLIMHAGGPNAPALASMTEDLWNMLLRLLQRASPAKGSDFDASVLEAVLFALLTTIDLNIERDGGYGIVRDMGKQLMETQAWVELVFEREAGNDGGGRGGGGVSGSFGRRKDVDDKVKMLTASLLIRIRDVVQKHQRLLVGQMLDY